MRKIFSFRLQIEKLLGYISIVIVFTDKMNIIIRSYCKFDVDTYVNNLNLKRHEFYSTYTWWFICNINLSIKLQNWHKSNSKLSSSGIVYLKIISFPNRGNSARRSIIFNWYNCYSYYLTLILSHFLLLTLVNGLSTPVAEIAWKQNS